MKNKLLLLFGVTVLSISAYSQKQTFEAKDGTKVDVEILNINPDEGRHASIYLGLFGPEGLNVFGASYYKPKSFYFNALAGPTGGLIDGSFFFTSKLKNSKVKQSVKANYSAGGITKYVITVPVEKRKSIGLHAGTEFINNTLLASEELNTYSSNGVSGGITFLSSRHTHWKIDDAYKEAQGSTVGRLNADVIYYFNRKLIPAKMGSDPTGIDDLSREIGFRIYFDGNSTVWSRKGRIALHYMLGAGKNSDLKTNISLFGGLGFGYEFL